MSVSELTELSVNVSLHAKVQQHEANLNSMCQESAGFHGFTVLPVMKNVPSFCGVGDPLTSRCFFKLQQFVYSLIYSHLLIHYLHECVYSTCRKVSAVSTVMSMHYIQ